MDTKIEFTLELQDAKVTIDNVTTTQSGTYTCVLDFPSVLTFTVNEVTHYAKLTSLKVGGIPVPEHMLNQICLFEDKVTTFWTTPGTAKIEFFSSDFIQYHLLYNNRFTSSFS